MCQEVDPDYVPTTTPGTFEDPYKLNQLGDYVAAFPGGYDLVWYQIASRVGGYFTISSNVGDGVWFKIGTDIYNTKSNDGNGEALSVYVPAGVTCYFGVADWSEVACDIPFTVSFEAFVSEPVDHLVGTWTGTFSDVFGESIYTFVINENSLGTLTEDLGYYVGVSEITLILVNGTTVTIFTKDEYDNINEFVFVYDAEANTLTGGNNYINGTLTFGEATDEPGENPDVSYDTIIVIGSNVLYFSADEISADSATRQLVITVAGNYKFASGNLFVSSIVDADGNALTKNEDYSYTLAEGEYTVTFTMLSMFGVAADTACDLEVTEPVGGGDVGGGDEYPELVTDELKESLAGSYAFDGYTVMLYTSYDLGQYLANVYGEGFDLYFTYTVEVVEEGVYALTLTYYPRDIEVNPDMVDTVLGYSIVIGGSETPDEPTECEHEYEENVFFHPELVTPTCCTPGVAVFECIYCDHYYTVEVPADPEAHAYWGEQTIITEANCETQTNGLMYVACDNGCGSTNEVEISYYDAHNWDVQKETYATCTEAGEYYAVCTLCGEVEEYYYEANGHQNWYLTCGDTGECMECGEEFTVEHSGDPATCTDPMYCYNCWQYVGEPAGHSWVSATCETNGYCSVCEAENENAPAFGHDYDHVVTAPTCTAAGYTTHTCVYCDDSYTDSEVAALGHADNNGDFKCDNCSTKMLPADGTALTIPEALAIAKLAGTAYTTQKYYITGIITNVYNTTYGNMYIQDADGNELCIYGLYDYTGKIRYDAMEYKPVVGDEITVYTVLGMYNTTCQGKSAWLDEVVAHDHDYTSVVTNPTCTKEGYTTHTCSICNGYYIDSETSALGHTTDNGICENCGLTIGGDVVNNETFTADFNTVTSTNSSYVKSTTTSGWVATNCAVMGGGTSDSNPKFKVFGDASTRAFTMNGKTSAKGTIVSPTIEGGLSKLTFNYTNCFSENNGVDITITIKQDGVVVATKKLDNNSVTKLTAYEFTWDLAAEGVAVTGDFTIEFTNNSPSNSTSNKDRVSIWNLQWTTNY